MSIINQTNSSNVRVKPFKLNEVNSIEKKLKFCGRPNASLIEKDSGKQAQVELQTMNI